MIRTKAFEQGFQLVGFTSAAELETIDFPAGRGLKKPSAIMPEARTIIVLGLVVWDDAFNSAIEAPTGEHFNFYRETLEMLGLRLANRLAIENDLQSKPTHEIHVKVAAMLAGLGCIGRNSLLITPQYGPHARFAVS